MAFKRTSSKIIKDHKKLSFDYVPKELPNRDKQIQRLFTLFKGVVDSDISQNAFLHGSVGTGKTATAKRFCMDFKDYAHDEGKKLEYVFVNCRRSSNNGQVMWKIISKFDKGFPDRGFSVGEMMEILNKHIKKKGVHLVVILDEVDVLIKKEGSELIYLFSRFDDESLTPKGSVSLILISQKNALEFLEEGALSSFKRGNRVNFPRYDSDELYDILDQRSLLALYPDSIGDEELKLLSDIASKRGDARLGIELMEKSALLSEEKGEDKIDAEGIRRAKAEVDPHFTENRIRSLNDQERVILLAATRRLKNKAYTTTGELEEQYKVTAEEYGLTPLGHTQFWKYIKSLTKEGLLDSKTVSIGSGRTTKITVSDIPAKVLESKLETMIEG
ncbi:MAG: Cdc6/Cdc18 family protein [Thermoplasmatota archaeon]